MTELMHVAPIYKMDNIANMSRILVPLTSIDNKKEWNKVFQIITNAYNHISTWQANEALIMITELKNLFSEKDCYELTWNDSASKPTTYTGLDLTILKAQKLTEAIMMLQTTEMINLFGVKDEICEMCIDFLPSLKDCYLSSFVNNETLLSDLDNCNKQMEQYEEACKHKDDYVEFMLRNKYSNTDKNAEARFAKKYPKEFALVSNSTDIINSYSTLNSQWKNICKHRSIMESSIETIFVFLKGNGKLEMFLKTI